MSERFKAPTTRAWTSADLARLLSFFLPDAAIVTPTMTCGMAYPTSRKG